MWNSLTNYNYISNEDTIILSLQYNKPLDTILNIQVQTQALAQYEKIFFSNYELNDGLFEALKNNVQNLIVHYIMRWIIV